MSFYIDGTRVAPMMVDLPFYDLTFIKKFKAWTTMMTRNLVVAQPIEFSNNYASSLQSNVNFQKTGTFDYGDYNMDSPDTFMARNQSEINNYYNNSSFQPFNGITEVPIVVKKDIRKKDPINIRDFEEERKKRLFQKLSEHKNIEQKTDSRDYDFFSIGVLAMSVKDANFIDADIGIYYDSIKKAFALKMYQRKQLKIRLEYVKSEIRSLKVNLSQANYNMRTREKRIIAVRLDFEKAKQDLRQSAKREFNSDYGLNNYIQIDPDLNTGSISKFGSSNSDLLLNDSKKRRDDAFSELTDLEALVDSYESLHKKLTLSLSEAITQRDTVRIEMIKLDSECNGQFVRIFMNAYKYENAMRDGIAKLQNLGEFMTMCKASIVKASDIDFLYKKSAYLVYDELNKHRFANISKNRNDFKDWADSKKGYEIETNGIDIDIQDKIQPLTDTLEDCISRVKNLKIVHEKLIGDLLENTKKKEILTDRQGASVEIFNSIAMENNLDTIASLQSPEFQKRNALIAKLSDESFKEVVSKRDTLKPKISENLVQLTVVKRKIDKLTKIAARSAAERQRLIETGNTSWTCDVYNIQLNMKRSFSLSQYFEEKLRVVIMQIEGYPREHIEHVITSAYNNRPSDFEDLGAHIQEWNLDTRGKQIPTVFDQSFHVHCSPFNRPLRVKMDEIKF